MAKKADLRLSFGANPDEDDFHCDVVIYDTSLIGKRATLEVLVHIEVLDNRPVHDEKVVFSQLVTLAREERFTIPRAKMKAYTYNGIKIYIEIHVRLEVDDGIFFDYG